MPDCLTKSCMNNYLFSIYACSPYYGSLTRRGGGAGIPDTRALSKKSFFSSHLLDWNPGAAWSATNKPPTSSQCNKRQFFLHNSCNFVFTTKVEKNMQIKWKFEKTALYLQEKCKNLIFTRKKNKYNLWISLSTLYEPVCFFVTFFPLYFVRVRRAWATIQCGSWAAAAVGLERMG